MVLTGPDLAGIYSFVPTPWTADGTLDEAILRHDLEYLCDTALHGVYTPDGAGEFYELEFDEFRRLVDIVLDVVDGRKPVQIGCHWTNAAGAVRRAEYASSHGADAIRVTVPYWEELSVDEAIDFLAEVGAASHPTPVVHYGTAATAPVFDAGAYSRVVEEVPEVIGTKLDYHDPLQVIEIVDRVPDLTHFVSEYVFTDGLAAGAEGCYSWLAATNPDLAVDWYTACNDGDWDRAVEIQTMILRWSARRLDRWGFASTAARTKLDAGLNPNLECPLRVRRPFDQGTDADLEWGRRWLQENEPEILIERAG